MGPFDEIAGIIDSLPCRSEEAILRVRKLVTAAMPQPASPELIELVDAFYVALEQAVLEPKAAGSARSRNDLLMSLYTIRREATRPREDLQTELSRFTRGV